MLVGFSILRHLVCMNENKTAANKVRAFTKHDLGCIIDQSCGSANDLNKQTIQFAQENGYSVDWESIALCDEEDRSQYLSEEADDAVNFLNNLNMPSCCSFFFEDNSLFLSPSVESAKEDVEFISSEEDEYPGDDYEGGWLHVSDHGNATLYNRFQGSDEEVWSVV